MLTIKWIQTLLWNALPFHKRLPTEVWLMIRAYLRDDFERLYDARPRPVLASSLCLVSRVADFALKFSDHPILPTIVVTHGVYDGLLAVFRPANIGVRTSTISYYGSAKVPEICEEIVTLTSIDGYVYAKCIQGNECYGMRTF